MLKLFYSPGACSLASHIALEEAGADYEAVRIAFAADQQRTPEYLAINPKGRVPALVTDRGVVTETPAILAYIATAFPKAKLAPLDDPFAFAQLQAFNSFMCSTVHVNHAHHRRAARWADEPSSIADIQRKVPQTVAESYTMIEEKMLVGPWVMGDSFSVADCYLFTLGRWMGPHGVDIARFPKVQAHANRMAERPAVKKVLAAEA